SENPGSRGSAPVPSRALLRPRPRGEVEERVSRDVPAADLEMQVRARGASRIADASELVALLHHVAERYFVLRIVRVDGGQTARVLQDHDVPISRDLVAVNDASVACRIDWRAFRRTDVDAVVERAAA